jgi:hypothetical protein
VTVCTWVGLTRSRQFLLSYCKVTNTASEAEFCQSTAFHGIILLFFLYFLTLFKQLRSCRRGLKTGRVAASLSSFHKNSSEVCILHDFFKVIFNEVLSLVSNSLEDKVYRNINKVRRCVKLACLLIIDILDILVCAFLRSLSDLLLAYGICFIQVSNTIFLNHLKNLLLCWTFCIHSSQSEFSRLLPALALWSLQRCQSPGDADVYCISISANGNVARSFQDGGWQ